MGSKQRKAKNGVDNKYHRMDGNALRRPRETAGGSGEMEIHDSQPSSRRRHLMIVMIQLYRYVYMYAHKCMYMSV